MRYCAHAALFWLLVFATFCGRRGCATKVVHVGPGQLHLCATAAEQAERDAQSTASEPEITRCVLAPGVYREALVYGGYAPLEIVGAGQGVTQLRGDEPLAGLSWAPSPDPETSIFSAGMPAGVLRTAGVQQAFFDDQWLPEARYPNANLNNILQLTSWGFCGKGSAHGYCKDRPDAWSALPRKNWTGALATLSLGTRIATWTRKVTSHGPGWFTYPASLGPGPGTRDNNKPGARYFLSGVLAALDSPGEWFIDEEDWTIYVWAPDSKSPGDRVSLRVRDFCVDTAHTAVKLQNLSMHGCTFRLRNCTGCAVSDVNITYASYNRYLHLRDPQPFHRGPPPNITLMEGNNNSVSRLALRYSNSAGLKVVGSHNRLEELLILDTDWLGTLDYPPVEIGFGNDCDSAEIRNANASGCRDVPPFPGGMLEESTSEPKLALGDRMTMYPRNIFGTNNTITRATVGRCGSAGIVTSQLSNEVSFSHVFGAGRIGLDDAGIHADNSRANNLHCGGDRCVKVWHHNWVHDCKAKCVRGDDFTKNLTLHHNMIWNCGEPKSDGGGQSFGVVLKGDYNKFYSNTVLRTAQADVVICTGEEGPNKHTVIVNNVASRWSGKKGPRPPSPAQKKAGNWGGNVEAADVGMFVDFATFDFRPKNSSQIIGKGVLHPPEVLGPNQHPDAGAYQSSADTHPWRAGCTFSPECNISIPSPPPPPSPCAAPGAGWTCRQRSYCGPKQSFYWTGQLDFANCYAACAANSTGCSCFDHLTGPDENSVADGDVEAECRLHVSATDIVTNEVSHYTAYWRNRSANEPNH